MRKLNAFIFTTLDGYFEGPTKGDISWHKHGKEENEYAAEKLKTGNATLLFGRVTYEMMAGYWPTELAIKNDPIVAKGMNSANKIVFSKTMKKASWNNTTLINGDLEKEIKKLKQLPGDDITLLGSGSLLKQLAELGLVDEVQVMTDPIIIGKGSTIFKGAKQQLELKLTLTKTFKSGVILHCYHLIKN